jgi:hypothetical protein
MHVGDAPGELALYFKYATGVVLCQLFAKPLE